MSESGSPSQVSSKLSVTLEEMPRIAHSVGEREQMHACAKGSLSSRPLGCSHLSGDEEMSFAAATRHSPGPR